MSNHNSAFDLSRMSDMDPFYDDACGDEETEGTPVDRSGGDETHKIKIADEENLYVNRMRWALFLVLLLAALFVGMLVYYNARKAEEHNFEEAYYDMAQKLVDAFQANSKRRLAAVESMAAAITSSAIAEGRTWPNVTLPDYERRATYTMDQSDLVCLFFVPFVTGENREGWEGFATENQGWIEEGLKIQGDIAVGQEDEQESIEILERSWGTSPNGTIPRQIISLTGTGVEIATGAGPFAPTWQMAPAIPVQNVINYDALSHPTRRFAVKTIMKNPTTLITEAWDYSDTSNPTTVGKKAALNLFLNRRKGFRQSYQDGPVSDLYVPIYESLEFEKCPDHLYHPCRAVGYLTGYVYWQAFLLNILPPNSKEVTVVLSNTCGQSYTYSVQGESAFYEGPGDLHDTKFDYLEKVTTGWNAFLVGEEESPKEPMEGNCLYKVQVGPTQALQDNHTTDYPWMVTVVILSTFLITSFMFVMYDYLVARRQRILHARAVKSTAIVHSLFPEQVRSRLQMGSEHMKVPTKPLEASFSSTSKVSDSVKSSDIVADLYPAATVLFADLAGFTSWSCQREPKQVFLLLECIYGAFDAIAERRRVFKIETIGDCYLAVTGVPKPQKTHALIMARFAAEMMSTMDSLIRDKLVRLLGEETANLKLRAGIHSGPVTAGVLRGHRARFQLFGDTVNTASRFESNGVPGQIQLSESTARLLKKAGKASWMIEREGGIEAKGKGQLRSFFLQTNVVTSGGLDDGSSRRRIDEDSV